MWYKKFCRVWIVVILLVSIAVPLLSIIVDPFNIFHWDCARNNGIVPNERYIKTKFIIANPLRYNAYIFGSSRVGSIHVENIKGLNVYNMTYSVGLPSEHLESLKTLQKAKCNIRRIYIGIDDILLYVNEKMHRDPLRSSYEYLTSSFDVFWKMYVFNPQLIKEALKYYSEGGQKNSTFIQMYQYGWWADYNQQSNYNWSQVENVLRTNTSINAGIFNEALSSIEEIKRICDANHIELIVFTNPTYRTTYIGGLNKGYIDFLRELVKTTDFYNFSGLNDVTINKENYLDTSHYNAYVGDMIIDVIHNNKRFDKLHEQGFGWYVTQDNIEKLLNLIDVKEGSY